MSSNSTNYGAEQKLICAICLKRYNDPRLLPCSHTYCLACIKKDASTGNNQFECPIMDGTKISRTNADALPPNQAINDALEYFDMLSGRIQCSNCEKENGRVWCTKCNMTYCQNCTQEIHRHQAFLNHEQIPVKDKPITLANCSQHQRQKLQHFCTKCDVLVCCNCLLYTHQNHPHEPIEKASNYSEELEKQMKKVLKILENKEIETKSSMKTRNQEYEGYRKELERAFECLEKTLADHKNETLQKLDHMETKETTTAIKYANRIRNEKESLEKQNMALSVLSSNTDPVKLLNAQQSSKDYFKRLTTALNNLNGPTQYSYTVSVQPDDIKNAQDCIVNSIKVVENHKTMNEDILDIDQYKGESNESLENEIFRQQSPLGLSDIRKICDDITTKPINKIKIISSRIDRQGMEHLADALANNNTITTLDLYKCDIRDAGVQLIANMLRQNQKIATLHLSNNHIGDYGVQCLADALKQNQTLEVLHLAHNQIDDEGAQHLADALSINQSLSLLNLHNNQITSEGAQAFANGLRQNQKLGQLYLSKNQIDDNGARRLIEMLKSERRLRTLTLHENNITAYILQDLQDSLAK